VSSTELQAKSKPSWLKVRFPSHQNFFYVSKLLKEKKLHTICLSAKCPNVSECWSQKTATFLILGETCTRDCHFCAVDKGSPLPPPDDEAERVSDAIAMMGIQYAVITSVTRDDLPDGGASLFSETIKAVREKNPGAKIEVLIPDFKGDEAALMTVVNAQPDVLNHNIEAPEILYPFINRPISNYAKSLEVLERAKEWGLVTKSGIMVGLGEKSEDIIQSFSDLSQVSCDFLTIGQYLQPTKSHVSVAKYYSPEEFNQLRHIALDFGFQDVVSGPMVRSSYKAHKMFESLKQESSQARPCVI
jgi:lipoic acid synthetase